MTIAQRRKPWPGYPSSEGSKSLSDNRSEIEALTHRHNVCGSNQALDLLL